MIRTNSPKAKALLGLNRDALSNSHRYMNKKIRNARDVLKVADFKSEQKFVKYQSPATKKTRVTSSKGKRALSALRKSQKSLSPDRSHTNLGSIKENKIGSKSRQSGPLNTLQSKKSEALS